MRNDRRTFLKSLAAMGGAAMTGSAWAADWKSHIGLELYTVRDLIGKDYEGVLAKVAEMGYKEIEPATNYGNMEPKAFRAMLDRLGLTMPSTHVGATEGPDLEKQLEGFQVMGIRYTEVRGAAPARGAGAAPTQAGAARGPAGARPLQTEEQIKRQAAELNRHGGLVKKFGMKMLMHNHTMEFAPLEGSAKRPYDVLLAETDPALVAMQLDIGWASVAGQDILAMFAKNPGRFELWHVKDAQGIRAMPADMPQAQRQRTAKLVPVGEGEVNYKAIFAKADLAGMKHFCIEQDNAIDGDSMAAARTSLQNLRKILS
jgi:sugar phosphate isomerase/epimerase